MDNIQTELLMNDEAIAQMEKTRLCELDDLQLALVGGGIGDVVPH